MKTTIVITEGALQLTVSGITVVLKPESIFADLKVLKTFAFNIVPERFKDEVGTQLHEVFNNLDALVPLAQKFISCWKMESGARQEITINTDGTIDMESSAQRANFDFKKYMEVFFEVQDMIEDPDKFFNTESYQRRQRSQAAAERLFKDEQQSDDYLSPEGIKVPLDISFEDLCELLGENIYGVQKHLLKHQGISVHDKQILSAEQVRFIADEFGYRVNIIDPKRSDNRTEITVVKGETVDSLFKKLMKNLRMYHDIREFLEEKSPIETIKMGHIHHINDLANGKFILVPEEGFYPEVTLDSVHEEETE